jgi:type IV pilus assembly protein PilX
MNESKLTKQTLIKTKPAKLDSLREQTGAALITGLIFLVILTLLGFSASRGVIMQELIARNFRDQDLALQAAETALKDAENCIRTTSDGSKREVATVCTSTGTLISVVQSQATNIRTTNQDFWTANGTQYGQMSGASALDLPVSQQPRYVIALIDQSSNTNFTAPAPYTYAYQITAWGTGINANTQKVVQSVFVR